MKRALLYIPAITFLIGICACRKEETATAFEENIKIRMYEKVDSVKRTLNLMCYTEKMFECANFKIETTYTITDNKITISFIKVLTSSICLTLMGPASTTIELKGLSNKTYDLEFNFGISKVSGLLNITTNSFIATVPVQTKVQFENSYLKRIP